MLHHAPPEQHGLQLGLGRFSFGDHFQLRRGGGFHVPVLQQERIGADAADVPGRGRSRVFPDLEHSQVPLFLQQFQCVRVEVRGDDDFAEDFGDGLGAGQIQPLIDRDDSPKRRLSVRGQGPVPRFAQALSLPDAAGIGVLENRQRRRVVRKFRDQIRRGRQVENIVVGKLLAVQLLKVIGESTVKRGSLVRVLAVTQWLRLRGFHNQHRRQRRRGQLQRQG